jgi:cardiolipin synthase A/B
MRAEPIRALPTTAKVLASVVAILSAALLFAQDQETLRIQSPLAADDPQFPGYAGALTGSALTTGDEYRILVNGVEIFPAMLDAIRSARHRINFETYIFDEGEMGTAFSTALADAARRGVRVRLLVDAVGAKWMDGTDAQRMLAAGVRIASFNPLHWYSIEEINYRTHRKILVVDGQVAFTGGAGIADHWLGNADSRDRWRDTHVQVKGPAVTQLEAAFYENWAETGHVSAAELDLDPPPAHTGAQSIVAWSSPTGGTNEVKLLFLLSVAAARRTLDISSPYLVLDDSTRYVIFEARRRGVRIRLLVEGELTDARPVKFAGRSDYDGLLAHGIEIFEYQPTMMHVKATIVDGAWSLIGSTNFDNRSFELNDEINIAIKSTDVARKLTEDFEADLRRSMRLDLESWRERPLSHKARERMWGLFGELF